MGTTFSIVVLASTILLFLLSVASCLLPESVNCTGGEREALLHLKLGFHDPGGVLSSWVGREQCRWLGVECDNKTGLVLNLTLAGPRLGGEINPSLLCLKNLQSLIFFFTNFNGAPIPEFMGSLKNLRYLLIFYSYFSGPVPSILGELSYLERLNLKGNMLSGPLPSTFRRLSSLQHLSLAHNNFSGSIPSYFGELSSLQFLDLSSNTFSGPIPPSLGNLSSITFMDFSDNALGGLIPSSLGGLKNLEYLVLSHNFLEGILSESFFSNLTKLSLISIDDNEALEIRISEDWNPPPLLKYFRVRSCKVGRQFPSWIRNYRYGTLDMSNSEIKDRLPEWIWANHNFNLNLSHNQIIGEIPSSRPLDVTFLDLSSNLLEGQLPDINTTSFLILSNNSLSGSLWKVMPSRIMFLSLSMNKLNGTIPSTFCHPVYNRSYGADVLVDLSRNSLSGEIPACLMETTVSLNLADNNFSGSIPDLSSCHLKSLRLNKNNLFGTLPLSLSKCIELEVLDLSQNRLIGGIPSWIAHYMSSLKILRLRSNMFSGSIHPDLSSLSNLQVMDIAWNKLSGNIPRSFGNLKAMKASHNMSEDLAYNKVIGYDYYTETISLTMNGRELSYVRTQLVLITSLDLSDNFLSGDIPGELGDLLSLGNLNLSRNHLMGRIPENLSKLSQLRYLDLSENPLSGEIPQSLVNLTFLSKLDMSSNNLSGRIPTSSQFSTFSELSYVNNPNLCGFPLRSCKFDLPNVAGGDTDMEYEKHVETVGLYFCVSIGFLIGFWGLYGTLLFKMSWRHSYIQFMDEMYDKIYVVFVKYSNRFTKYVS